MLNQIPTNIRQIQNQQFRSGFAVKQHTDMPSFLASIPIAEKQELATDKGVKLPHRRAIVVNGQVVGIVSNHYELVQHKDAFAPVVEALQEIPYSFRTREDKGKLCLSILTNQASDGAEGILFGFNIKNSLDGSSKVKFGFASFKGKKWVEIVGFRLACSNGLIVQVPAEQAEFFLPIEKQKLELLAKEKLALRHSKGVNDKLVLAKYITEAMLLFKSPLERMIKFSQEIKLDSDEVRELIKQYVGKRLADSIRHRYNVQCRTGIDGEASLWGLFNAITYVASHEAKNGEPLLRKGAELLREVCVARIPSHAPHKGAD